MGEKWNKKKKEEKKRRKLEIRGKTKWNIVVLRMSLLACSFVKAKNKTFTNCVCIIIRKCTKNERKRIFIFNIAKYRYLYKIIFFYLLFHHMHIFFSLFRGKNTRRWANPLAKLNMTLLYTVYFTLLLLAIILFEI